MADVRALLKSKRQEQRITHPYASYTLSGQLRCKACDMIIKYASAWNGHVGSKGHRTAVAKLKEEEALATLKRKSDELPHGGERENDEAPVKKRKLDEEDNQPSGPAANFPADFFSDPTRTLYQHDDSDGTDGENELNDVKLPKPSVQKEPNGKDVDDVINQEWAAFQASILNNDDKEVATREVFERATVVAEPELVDELPPGIPESVIPRRAEVADPVEPIPAEQPLDEAQVIKRRQEEEKELIMDRLDEEERFQEEADERVSVLKARLELIKQRRMLAKKSKQP